MRFLQIAALAAALVNVVLTLVVLRSNRRSNLNRVYFLWGTALTLWNVSTFFLADVAPERSVPFWMTMLQLGVILIPVSLFHLCLILAEYRISRWIAALYALHLFFAASLFSGHFIGPIRKTLFGYWATPGPVFLLFISVYSCMTASVIAMLYLRQRKVKGLRRLRIRALLIALLILWFCGSNDLLPILGFDFYPGTKIPFFPLGNIAAIFYGLIVGYSTLQHEMLDVHVVLGRAAAQVLRFAFVMLTGLVVLLILLALAPGQFTAFSLLSALIMLAATTVIASVFFPRLFGSGGERFERRLLGDHFEYHDRVRSFTNALPLYSDANLLLSDLDELLGGTIGVGSYKIILHDEASRVFSLFRSHPEEEPRQLPELHAKSPVFQFFEKSKAEYLACGAGDATSYTGEMEERARDQLAQFDAEFCLPFFFEEQPFGLLLLGRKANDEPYTATDISLLVLLMKSLSLVINQIRLRDHVLRAQEMDLLGRMSRGLAHDLNNLLTPVWTLAELASTGASMEDITEDILPVAMRNLKTMRAYIREALFFSENLRPDFQLGRLDVLVKQAVDVLEGKRAQKQIRINVTAPSDALIEMDEVLIQRLIGNILSNAIDASPQGSSIRVDVTRLIQTDAMRDWFRVRVIDEGEGIAPEHLSRISTPYFTTKNRGDETRGFGLGLAICRKIIHLHAANMNVFSQVKKGTTVQVDMPSRQLKPAEPATPSFKQ